MFEYIMDINKDIDLIEIARCDGAGGYDYWNNRWLEWQKNSSVACDAFFGDGDDAFYTPITEEEANEIIAKYSKEAAKG